MFPVRACHVSSVFLYPLLDTEYRLSLLHEFIKMQEKVDNTCIIHLHSDSTILLYHIILPKFVTVNDGLSTGSKDNSLATHQAPYVTSTPAPYMPDYGLKVYIALHLESIAYGEWSRGFHLQRPALQEYNCCIPICLYIFICMKCDTGCRGLIFNFSSKPVSKQVFSVLIVWKL